MEQEVTITQQVADQYLAVVALAENIALVHRQIEPMIRQGVFLDLNDMRGRNSARVMELLGDILNNMDAVDEEDAWMTPIFDRAHKMFPSDAWNTKALSEALASTEALRAEIAARDAEVERLREALRHIHSLASEPTAGKSDAALAGLLFNIETVSECSLAGTTPLKAFARIEARPTGEAKPDFPGAW